MQAKRLEEQRRAHLLAALYDQPNNPGLRKELGLDPFSRDLLTPERTSLDRSKRFAAVEGAKRWRGRMDSLLDSFKSSDLQRQDAARREVLDIHDPAAVPAMEGILSTGNEAAALAVVAALDSMPGRQATDSLVKHALLCKHASARAAAADALKSRSFYDWVPQMMASLRSPVRPYVDYVYIPGKTFRAHVTLYRDSPLYQSVSARSIGISLHPLARDKEAKAAVQKRSADVLAAVNSIGASVQRQNDTAAFLNERAIATLSRATGERSERTTSSDPEYWWSWWSDYNDIYEPPPYQVTEYRHTTRYVRGPNSCFVAGTPIWTSSGSMAIEHAQGGDLVLAQNVDSGELAFKPVTGVTVRPATRVLAIQTDDGYTVTATRGHPFWVAGQGWRMAKELKVGDRLHKPTGSVEITDINEPRPEKAYNLFVADFSTYFVGENRLLVHDNTMRQPTDAVLPGLVSSTLQIQP